MTAGALAARAVELLGPLAGPLAVRAARVPALTAALGTHVRIAAAGERPAAAVVVFLRLSTRPDERQETLRDVQRTLPQGAPLVLIDHNQPRRLWRRALGVARLALRGVAPARARYPAARELAALGFHVERLRLACGERVQLVLARR